MAHAVHAHRQALHRATRHVRIGYESAPSTHRRAQHPVLCLRCPLFFASESRHSRPHTLSVLAVLCSGLGPRVFWISIGGAVFLGCYEQSKQVLINVV